PAPAAKPAPAPAQPAPKPATAPAQPAPKSTTAPANAAAAKPAAAPAHGPSKVGAGGRLEFKLPDIGEGVAEGEIVKWLVEAFAKARESAPAMSKPAASAPRAPVTPLSFAPGERETRIPFRGVRRKIAEAMVRSKFTAAHFTVVEEVDVTDLVKLREQAKAF